ncbi:nucleotide sugar dehydrogenase [Aquisphaera insulae]|uniref:nucleotide sugar dehydrogenase n=1 Tax=Aquisphaera insulae TaxID=2712864 RepID=UPI0013EAB12B|nr:nucleotide sugar dehydrogenase [Aquisphaera insulae]
MGQFRYDVCVVGGCGHVGLPLALAFARSGLDVAVHDIDDRAVDLVRSGRMPFLERGAEPILRQVIGRNLIVADDPGLVTQSRHLVVIIGTPVDEHLNPKFHAMRRFFLDLRPHLTDGQCVILRSTVAPGTTEKIHSLLARTGLDLHVAFCPERVAEGYALEEFATLPQIVSGCGERAVEMASELFAKVAPSLIRLSPLEAELTKIFTNAWRYIQFATANQFLMIAADRGVDFYRVFDAMTRDYPRMAGLPKGGFAAGPCLFKDTMQLAASSDNNLPLGHAAMLINEGLPSFIARRLRARYPLESMCIGILGMAFKAESDDHRESLSYKLRKVIEAEAAEVLCTDAYIADPTFRPLAEVVERSDLLIIGAPHREYRAIAVPISTPVVDLWNFLGKGTGLA